MSNFHKSLADKFNRKKTFNSDISRIYNIYKKPYSNVPVFKYNEVKNITTDFINPTETAYSFDKIKISKTLNLNTTRENDIVKIPKITLKEIIVPSYSINDKFDINTINQNISTPIHMDIFASEVINDGDINRLKKKHVKKIYHIYQEKYVDNYNPTGLGDFVRGCFFIIQFCNKYGFELEIIINHPVSLFLEKYNSNKIISKLFNTVCYFGDTNWNKTNFDSNNNIEQFILSKQKYNLFINYLCSLPVINNTILSYNIFFPTETISINETIKIKSMFKPSREMSEYIDNTLETHVLTKNEFIVLHIRSGDSYLKGENKIFNSTYFDLIKNEINEIMFNNQGKQILLIADNKLIKYLLHDEFPSIKMYFKDITHLGEGVNLERDKVKNTLLDFFLMSYSSFIYSFTSYPHGSGFSYWCSMLYNIQYKCKYINVK